MISTMIGAVSGFTIRLWANAIARERPLAKPWLHAIFTVTGGYIGYNYFSWEQQMLDAVNEKRVSRGMPKIERQSMISLPASLRSQDE